MKIFIVDRSKCEVYFMPFENKKPIHAEIHTYLRIHYPFFSASCRVYSHPCVICGSKFLIVTVFQAKEKNKKKSILNGYSSTASSLLVQSSYAKKICEIICENEHIRFGKNPESFYLGDRQNDNSETINLTLDDLHELVEKEHLKGYRYGKHLTFVSILAFGAAALLLLAPLVDTKSKMENTIPVVFQPIPETQSSPTFWETFILETNAVNDSNGVIREYEYDVERIPTHRLDVLKCDPGYLYDELIKKSIFQDIVIPSVAYQQKEYSFEVCYSVAQPSVGVNTTVGGNTSTDMYADSRYFGLFCAQNYIDLAEISFNPIPVYSLKVGENIFSKTCIALAKYCDEKNKTIRYLHIQRNGESGIFSIITSLVPAQNNIAYEFSEFSYLESVFGVQKKKTNTTNIQLVSAVENHIGKIHEIDNSYFVFSKSKSGKIQMEARNTYE